MKILAYTFFNHNHLTFKLLKSLEHNNLHKFYLGDINKLTRHILKSNYDHILGLGDYRRNTKRIRIEEEFVNKYGKNKINEYGKDSYQSTWQLQLKENAYLSNKASNGPCNRSGYLISKTISENNLKTKFTFVHIPRSYNFTKSKTILEEWLSEV